MIKKSGLIFYSGVNTVTGANFMLRDEDLKILIDCGLLQGKHFCEKKNCGEFAYNPAECDFLLVTHAHADHIGRIPKLIKEGFAGRIYSTLETVEMAKIMLEDSLRFVVEDARAESVEPIYDASHIKKAFELWKEIPYHEKTNLAKGISFTMKDAGHILGSAIFELERDGRKIAFSGDLGNSPSPFIRDTEDVSDADYLVVESVYGDRLHEDGEGRKEVLLKAVKETVDENGTLIIPAFSISRTQILLFELNDLYENGHIEPIPVFLDSPLAIKVTEIYKKYQDNFKKEAKELIKKGDKIFDFPRLRLTETVEESKSINQVVGPKIIIAGSGMSAGGRVTRHEKRYLGDSKNTLLIVGYQAPGSLGRLLQDGAREVRIEGSAITVRAKIKTITGYSGHRDSDGLLDFVAKSAKTLKEVFVVMGEPKSSMFFSQKIRDIFDIKAIHPEENREYVIKF